LSIGNSRFQSCTEKHDFQALCLRSATEVTVGPQVRGLLTSLVVYLSSFQELQEVISARRTMAKEKAIAAKPSKKNGASKGSTVSRITR